jgi:hypothetical protein
VDTVTEEPAASIFKTDFSLKMAEVYFSKMFVFTCKCDSEDGSNMLLQNTGIHLDDYTVSQLRGPHMGSNCK